MRITIAVIAAVMSVVSGADVQRRQRSADGSLFYIERENKFNWYDAWNECARKNMSLMAIDTSSKHQQIDTLIRQLFVKCPSMWIGGHDYNSDKHHVWSMTGEEFTFTNWGSGQPKRGIHHCIHIYVDWNWHDTTCETKIGFICEEKRYVKELETLKKESLGKAKEIKNIIVNFNSNPKTEYSFGNGISPNNLVVA